MPFIQMLPHDVRRAIYSVAKRPYFSEMQLKRKRMSEGYSFKPFDDTKSIFVHIPKAAGVSVCKSLYGSLAGGHTPIFRYQYVFSKKEFESYFKFTFVRNPWDRLYSAYTFLKKGGFNAEDRQWSLDNLSRFENFEAFVMDWVSPENIQRYKHFVPQLDLLSLPGEAVVPIDFLGFFENLPEDFAYVAEKMKKPVSLPRLNKTDCEGQSYLLQYSQPMIEVVKNTYRADIETFGYVFDNSTLDIQLNKRAAGQLPSPLHCA